MKKGLLLLALVAFFASGCGGGGDQPPSEPPAAGPVVSDPQPPADPAPPAPPDPDPVVPPPPPLANLCLAFGDSITFGVETSTPYVGILSGLLGKPVASAATDGGTSGVGAEIVAGAIGELRPGCVTIYYGTNDSGFCDPDWTAANLRYMVQTAKQSGAVVAIATLQPAYGIWEWRQPHLRELSARIREIASSEGVRLADIERAFNGDASLIGPDGLHPNDRGHRIIAETFASALRCPP